MPDQLVLPRLDAESVTTEQKTAARHLPEFADNPNADFRFQFEMVSYLVVVTFLTFSAPVILLARQGGRPRFRDEIRYIGVRNSAMDVVLGMVDWLYVGPRPKKVKESPVNAKAAEEVVRELILHHGDRLLNRSLRGFADRRRRIAVR